MGVGTSVEGADPTHSQIPLLVRVSRVNKRDKFGIPVSYVSQTEVATATVVRTRFPEHLLGVPWHMFPLSEPEFEGMDVTQEDHLMSNNLILFKLPIPNMKEGGGGDHAPLRMHGQFCVHSLHTVLGLFSSLLAHEPKVDSHSLEDGIPNMWTVHHTCHLINANIVLDNERGLATAIELRDVWGAPEIVMKTTFLDMVVELCLAPLEACDPDRRLRAEAWTRAQPWPSSAHAVEYVAVSEAGGTKWREGPVSTPMFHAAVWSRLNMGSNCVGHHLPHGWDNRARTAMRREALFYINLGKPDAPRAGAGASAGAGAGAGAGASSPSSGTTERVFTDGDLNDVLPSARTNGFPELMAFCVVVPPWKRASVRSSLPKQQFAMFGDGTVDCMDNYRMVPVAHKVFGGRSDLLASWQFTDGLCSQHLRDQVARVMDLDPCSFLMICEDNYLPVSPLLVKVARVVDIIDTQPQNDARAEVAYTEALKAFTCVVGSFSKWRRVVKDPSRTDLKVYDETVDKYRSDDFMPLTWSPDGKPNLEECERLNAPISTHVNSGARAGSGLKTWIWIREVAFKIAVVVCCCCCCCVHVRGTK